MKKVQQEKSKYLEYENDICRCLNVIEGEEETDKTLSILGWLIYNFDMQKARKDGNNKTRSNQLNSLNNLNKAIDNTIDQLNHIFRNIDEDDNYREIKEYLNNTSDYPDYEPCQEIKQKKKLNSEQDVKNANAMWKANILYFRKGKPLFYKQHGLYLGGWKDLFEYLIHTKKHIDQIEKQISKKPTKRALDQLIIDLVALFKQRNKLSRFDDYKANRERFIQLCLENVHQKKLITDKQKVVSPRLLNQAEKEAVNVTFKDYGFALGFESSLSCDLNLRK